MRTPGFGNPEIGQLHVALEGDHDILEADIAMDDAEGLAVLVGLGVGVGEAARDAAGDEHRQFERQLFAFVAQLMGELFEVDAPDQFHGDEEHAIGFTEVIGLNDVGVDEVRYQFGLADEVFDESFLAGVVGAHHLDGDALDEVARAPLLGFIHDAHAALENLPDDIVTKFVLDAEQRHGAMLLKANSKSSFAADFRFLSASRVPSSALCQTCGALTFPHKWRKAYNCRNGSRNRWCWLRNSSSHWLCCSTNPGTQGTRRGGIAAKPGARGDGFRTGPVRTQR